MILMSQTLHRVIRGWDQNVRGIFEIFHRLYSVNDFLKANLLRRAFCHFDKRTHISK